MYFHNSLISAAVSGVERGVEPAPSVTIISLKCFVSCTPAELHLAVSTHKEADADDSSGLLSGKNDRCGFSTFLS